jgi:hypothetical protein
MISYLELVSLLAFEVLIEVLYVEVDADEGDLNLS